MKDNLSNDIRLYACGGMAVGQNTTKILSISSILIKPSSSMCNMRCQYCFYFELALNRSEKNNSIMSKEVMRRIIDSAFLAVEADSINFSFQGGEPTLASIDYFYDFINYVKNKNTNIKVNYSIQTNGLLIDKNWVTFFKENNFLVGLSLDIIEDIHNEYRKDNKGSNTFERILHTKKLFDDYKVDYNILSVLTSKLAKYPNEVYKEIKKQNIKYIQFIPCLSSLYHENYACSLTPKLFSSFYNTLFKLWKEDFLNDNYYSISFFDNIVPMFGDYPPYTCGLNGKCQSQIVVESNGDIYPCDFYCEDKYKIGNILNNCFSSLLNIDFMNEEKILSKLCKACEFLSLCNGGCKRMTKNMYVSDNDSFCGFNNFLKTNKEDILKLWNIIK